MLPSLGKMLQAATGSAFVDLPGCVVSMDIHCVQHALCMCVHSFIHSQVRTCNPHIHPHTFHSFISTYVRPAHAQNYPHTDTSRNKYIRHTHAHIIKHIMRISTSRYNIRGDYNISLAPVDSAGCS